MKEQLYTIPLNDAFAGRRCDIIFPFGLCLIGHI